LPSWIKDLLIPDSGETLEKILFDRDWTPIMKPFSSILYINLASAVAKEEVSESWVTRYINRNQVYLISQ
jgi:hypothetical protein